MLILKDSNRQYSPTDAPTSFDMRRAISGFSYATNLLGAFFGLGNFTKSPVRHAIHGLPSPEVSLRRGRPGDVGIRTFIKLLLEYLARAIGIRSKGQMLFKYPREMKHFKQGTLYFLCV